MERGKKKNLRCTMFTRLGLHIGIEECCRDTGFWETLYLLWLLMGDCTFAQSRIKLSFNSFAPEL